jgi:GTP cyclohydrolase I
MNPKHEIVIKKLTEAYHQVVEVMINELGYNSPADLANFGDTPMRVAKAMSELVQPLVVIQDKVKEHLTKNFPTSSQIHGMIVSRNNLVWGLCPHHLLPIIMRVSLAYLPTTKVLGISKLSRIAELLARRPVLQEQYTADLADIFYKREEEEEKTLPPSTTHDLYEQLPSKGSMVQVHALHMCMACRGARHDEASIVTAEVRGAFKTQIETREEFMAHINDSRPLL